MSGYWNTIFGPSTSQQAERLALEENALRLRAMKREEENLLRQKQAMPALMNRLNTSGAMLPEGERTIENSIFSDINTSTDELLGRAAPQVALERGLAKAYPGPDDIMMGKPGEVPISKRTGAPIGEPIPGGEAAFKPRNMQIPGTNEVALARTQLDYDALAEAGYVESGTSVPGLPAPADKKSTPNDYTEDPNNPGRRVMVLGGSAAVSRAAELARPVLDERKLYNASANQYATMADLVYDDTGASDISLIFGFFKAADPESSVREGEFATVGEKMGLPSKLIGEIKSVSSGKGFLSPKARQDLVDAAGRAVKQRKKSLQRTFRDASGGIDALGVDRKAFIPFNVSDVNLEEVRKEFPDAKEDTAGRVYVMRNGKRAYVELDE